MKVAANVTWVKKREEFEGRIGTTLAATCSDYTDALDRSFYEERTWGASFKKTYRPYAREVVPAGPTRNTRDSEYLVTSRDTIFETPFHMKTFYRAHYAAEVFMGYITESGHFVPGRPLPMLVAAEFPWVETFTSYW
jgi:hypothetical protein